MVEEAKIEIPLNALDNLTLQIYSESARKESLLEISEAEARSNGESPYQLLEGYSYEFFLSDEKYSLQEISGIVKLSRGEKKNQGRITPRIYVGTLQFNVIELSTGLTVDKIDLEVRSRKADYRSDYRFMLEEITEKCTELIMQCNSPVSHSFTSDFEKDNQTAYQRFAFMNSLINSDEFNNALYKIISSPVTKWKEDIEQIDIRRVKRIRNSGLRQIVGNSNRVKLTNHPLNKVGLDSVPSKIQSSKKVETVDTPENRFIKHVLKEFHAFCSSFEMIAKGKAQQEARVLVDKLDYFINHAVFKKVARPNTLNLNSPVLQRKEGYREVLRAWIMYDLAAKLIWSGGEDVYKGNMRDVATLYEYWLFFKLLDLVSDLFKIEPKGLDQLIKETKDGLGLQLKQGKEIAIEGIYDSGVRKLNVKFAFNRSFQGQKVYPDAGSWTRTLRPDYTISVWPNGISEVEAEKQELIVHIHFDAKYKVENLRESFTSDVDLDEEKTEQRTGKYKNADLLKMHAYRDAIRRTGGAYVLYPGSENVRKEGFHEIIPGLGAFPIRPVRGNDGGKELKEFITEIISHFLNRASQWENMSYRTYDIHKDDPDELKDLLPEPYGENRGLIPEETSVLVAFYDTPEHLEWYKKSNLYNFRTESNRGSLVLTKDVVDAKYLLLHTRKEQTTAELWKIKSKGPKIYSKGKLIKSSYPSKPSMDYYLVVEVEKDNSPEFKDVEWNFRELEKLQNGHNAAVPFAISLTELMKVKAN